MYPYARLAHSRVLRSSRRSQSHIYTNFYRSPGQLEALTLHVIPFICRGTPPRSLSINIVACSTGAEAYTVASELIAKFPGLDFKVHGSDLHEETIARARAARYTSAEVFLNENIPDEFVVRTFDPAGEDFIIKPVICEKVSFTRADLLDPDLARRFEPADIVFAQNVFFHLEPADAITAFENVLGLLKDRSALFIDGMELDMKERLTARAGLIPLAYKCREIHSSARRHVPARWWKYYFGMEPYLVFRRGRLRRYSTIFLNGGVSLENPNGIKAKLIELKELRVRFGVVKTLENAVFRLVNRFFYFDCLHIIVLDRENLKPLDPTNTNRFSSKIATREDLEEMEKQGCWSMRGRMKLFERGDTCLLSYVENKLSGYTWIFTNGCPSFVECGLRLSVPDGYLYTTYSWTHPEYRGYGLQSFRHHEILNHPRWRDKKGLLGLRLHTNHSTKRGQGKSGFQGIGNIYIIGRKSNVHALIGKNLQSMGIKRVKRPSSAETK